VCLTSKDRSWPHVTSIATLRPKRGGHCGHLGWLAACWSAIRRAARRRDPRRASSVRCRPDGVSCLTHQTRRTCSFSVGKRPTQILGAVDGMMIRAEGGDLAAARAHGVKLGGPKPINETRRPTFLRGRKQSGVWSSKHSRRHRGAGGRISSHSL